MLRTDTITRLDKIDGLAKLAKDFPDFAAEVAQAAFKKWQPLFLDELRAYPGPVQYPIQWTSRKQQRYVMAKLRRENNLPYTRTNDLRDGWYTRLSIRKDRFVLVTGNKVDYAPFVVGRARPRANDTDWQQQFHKNTGWQPIAPTIAFWRDAYREAFFDEFELLLSNIGGYR